MSCSIASAFARFRLLPVSENCKTGVSWSWVCYVCAFHTHMWGRCGRKTLGKVPSFGGGRRPTTHQNKGPVNRSQIVYDYFRMGQTGHSLSQVSLHTRLAFTVRRLRMGWSAAWPGCLVQHLTLILRSGGLFTLKLEIFNPETFPIPCDLPLFGPIQSSIQEYYSSTLYSGYAST